MQGKVKWFDEGRFYGFIAGDDGQDYFFHGKKLMVANSLPKEGDSVKFEIDNENPRGPSALKIILTND